MSILRLIIILFFIFLTCSTVDANRQIDPNVRVIDRQMIQASGISRLSEIFILIPEWSVSSIDGLTWNVSPNSEALYQHSSWEILVDGVLLELDLRGSRPLDMLPITINQLDYVEIISNPGIHFGEFIEAGAIHFHTKNIRNKTTLTLDVNLGNEIGDPGPYRYTEYGTQNIDRLGEAIAIDILTSSQYSTFTSDLKIDYHFPTDEAIRDRYSTLFGEFPKQRLYASSLNYRYEKGRWLQYLTGGFSYFENVSFNEFAKDESYAIERFAYAALTGVYSVSNNSDIKYEGSFHANYKKDYHTNSYILKGSYHRKHDNYQHSVGLKIKTVSNQVIEQNNSLLNMTLSNNLSWHHSASFSQTYAASLSAVDGSFGLEASINSNLIIAANQKLQFNIAFQDKQFAQDYQYWLWLEREQLTDQFSVFDYPDNSRRLSTQLSWTYHLQRHWMIMLSNRFAFVDNYYFNSETRVTVADGFIYGAGVCLAYDPTAKISVNINYKLTHESFASEPITRLWQEIPKHTFQATVHLEPVKSLTLWGRVKYSSATDWSEYEQSDIYLRGNYQTTISDMLLVDITLRKLLLDGKYMFGVGVRNLLNNTQRYHPLGARFDLNYHINLQARML